MKIEIANGEFIKCTMTDKDGEFSESGVVISQTAKHVEFKTVDGTNTIPWNKGEFTKIEPFEFPARVDKPEVQVEEVAPVAKKERAKRDPKTGTKLEKALVIYQNLEDKSRKNVIAVFVKELDMSPAGASTYQSTCKKQLGG